MDLATDMKYFRGWSDLDCDDSPDDVKFTDGEALTAADVAFTYNMLSG